MHGLPDHFIKTIVSVHGEEGEAWLATFPETLAAVAKRYDLTVGAPFKLSYNYVCAATRADGTPVVLKLSPPYGEFYGEVAALRHFDGAGCVALLDADPDAGVVILERIFPGEMLHDMALENDDEATHIMAEVMKKLWRPLPPDHTFRTVEDWSQAIQELRDEHGGGTGPIPAHLVERAEAIYRELFASSTQTMLLHGDLHHDNVLSATRAPYLAIDAKGVAGNPAYEVGPIFYNPQPELFQMPNLGNVLARRLSILVEHLEIDRERLLACAFVHSVLSSVWSVEDGEYDDSYLETVRVAEMLLTL